jgi:hypothetical protein
MSVKICTCNPTRNIVKTKYQGMFPLCDACVAEKTPSNSIDKEEKI